MKTIIQFWKRRRLRLAREKYVAAKAKREVLERADAECQQFIFKERLADAAAEAARLEERVEQLMRE